MNTPDQNNTNTNANQGNDQTPAPTPAQPVQPQVTQPIAAVPAAPAQGKWGRRFKTAAKWTGIGVVCAGLGAAGYFGAQYYMNRQ